MYYTSGNWLTLWLGCSRGAFLWARCELDAVLFMPLALQALALSVLGCGFLMAFLYLLYVMHISKNKRTNKNLNQPAFTEAWLLCL